MLTIIQGDNQVASRDALNQRLQSLRDQNQVEIINLNGEKIDLLDLKQAVETRSLFNSAKAVVIENLLSRLKSTLKETLLDYLATGEFQPEIILWEKKKLTVSQLKKFKTARITGFPLHPQIFNFLDSLAPGNRRQMLTLLRETEKLDPPEMIFYFLHRRVSDLIIAKDLGVTGLGKLAPWQKSKLVSQTKKFSLSGLLQLHRQLYQTDLETKTGKNILPLSSQLDLIIAGL